MRLIRHRKRLETIIEDYKSLDLKLYVIRQAHAANSNEIKKLSHEEMRVSTAQDAILLELSNMTLETLDDAMLCFHLWYLETIKNKKSWELSPLDQIMQNVFAFLKDQKS